MSSDKIPPPIAPLSSSASPFHSNNANPSAPANGEDAQCVSSLSPRRRTVSRFHAHYDSEFIHSFVIVNDNNNSVNNNNNNALSQNPSFAMIQSGSGGGANASMCSLSGVGGGAAVHSNDASSAVFDTKRSQGFLALDPEQLEPFSANCAGANNNGNHPNTNRSHSVRSPTIHQQNNSSCAHGGGVYAGSPSPQQCSSSRARTHPSYSYSASPSQPLCRKEKGKSLSIAVNRIIDEEAMQLNYETQLAGAIEMVQEEQRRKDQERKDKREAAKRVKEQSVVSKASATAAVAPINIDNSGNNAVTATAAGTTDRSSSMATSFADAIDVIGASGSNGVGQPSATSSTAHPHRSTGVVSAKESHLGSSISSQSEISEFDRQTLNSTPNGMHNTLVVPTSFQNVSGNPWSDTVSVASDVVGSDTTAQQIIRPPSSSNTTMATASQQEHPTSATKKNDFWGGLFKKDNDSNNKAANNSTTTSKKHQSITPSESSNNFLSSKASPSQLSVNASPTHRPAEQPSQSAMPQIILNNNNHATTPTPNAVVTGSNAPPTAASPSMQLQPLVLNLRSRVVLIGDQGSGKSSLKECFTPSVLKAMPEVSPSTQATSTMYNFKSEINTKFHQQRRNLDVTVIDSGPLPLSAGITNYYDDGTLFIMTMSLAGVKQKPPAKSINPFAPKQVSEPIIYEGDRKLIRSHLQTIAAISPKNAAFVMVGTFADLLSDTSQAAVEAVIAAIRSVIMSELAHEHYTIMFRGCFAVQCNDHKVFSDLRPTGPRHISDLWTMLCETMMKDAISNKGGVILQSPPSFGWHSDNISNAVGALQESGETITTSPPSLPQLGNLANTLLAKFVAESTRAFSSDNTFETNNNIATTSQSPAAPSPFPNWLSNVSADPSQVVDFSSVFTVRMMQQSQAFAGVEDHFSRIQKTVEKSDGAIDVVNEPFPRPCRSKVSTVATGFVDVVGDESLDKPRTQQELFYNVENHTNPFSPAHLLTAEDEVAQLILLRAAFKAQLFIRRSKSESNLVVTTMNVLRQHFFAIGIISKAQFHSALQALVRDGEITIFKRQPRGRDDTILYQPNLVSKAVWTVIRTSQLSSYPVADRKKLFPQVDPEEAQVADPHQKLANCGIISDLLLIAMSGCLSPFVRKSRGEAADLMQYLLVTSDFLLPCIGVDCVTRRNLDSVGASSCVGNNSMSGNYHTSSLSVGSTTTHVHTNDDVVASETPVVETESALSATTTRISNYFIKPKKSKMEILLETDCSFLGQGYRFVVPSLVKKMVDLEGAQAMKAILFISQQQSQHSIRHRSALSSSNEEKINKRSAFLQSSNALKVSPLAAHEHHITISPSTPFLRFKIMCRLARFVATPSCVSSNGVWLTNPQLMCRCLVKFDSVSSAPFPNSHGSQAQSEVLDFICVTGGSKIGALEFIEEIMKEIRNFIKYELRGSTITVLRNMPPPSSPKDSKIQLLWKAWLLDGKYDKLTKLDELFMLPSNERKAFLPSTAI